LDFRPISKSLANYRLSSSITYQRNSIVSEIIWQFVPGSPHFSQLINIGINSTHSSMAEEFPQRQRPRKGQSLGDSFVDERDGRG
jgi:hypothetical protein